MLLTVTPCIMLESCLKGKLAVSGIVAFALSYPQVLTRFVVDSTIAVYRNSVYTTRNIFDECGNVCNTLIPQFINAIDRSIIFINPFLVNFLRLVLARIFSADSVYFTASN